MQILIRDLPGDVTEEQLREYLRPFGDVEALSMTNVGNKERTSATVDMPLSTAVCEMVCDRVRQKRFNGHALRAEVLLFFK